MTAIYFNHYTFSNWVNYLLHKDNHEGLDAIENR
jgi:hypothetical protein